MMTTSIPGWQGGGCKRFGGRELAAARTKSLVLLPLFTKLEGGRLLVGKAAHSHWPIEMVPLLGGAFLISRSVPSLLPLFRARAPCVENKNNPLFCLLRAPGGPIERHWVATPPPE